MPLQPRVLDSIITNFQGRDYQNPRLFHPRSERITWQQALTVWLLALGLHALVWVYSLWQLDQNWSALLQHWDAGWYLKIVVHGYDLASAAFLPLFPYTIRGLAQLGSLQSNPAILLLGTGFSLVCYLVSLVILCRSSLGFNSDGLRLGALLAFLFSPASYIFHSFHTESYFLLFSVLAFYFLKDKKWLAAALFAGLSALVRHQGVFLAISIAFGASLELKTWPQRWFRFLAMGMISGAIWSMSLGLHYFEGRGFFPAVSAHQEHWFLADGLASYFKTLVLANPIQNFRIGSLIHHAFYGLLLFGLARVLQKRLWAEGLYCLASLAIMPLQGELVDAFRFGAVLFPVLFALGEFWQALPRWIAWPIFSIYLLLNLLVTWEYGIARWAY